MKVSRKIIIFWITIFRHFFKDQCLLRASALSFTSLLALVPLGIIIFSILSFFPFFSQNSEEVQAFLFQHFVPSSGKIIENYLIQFQNESKTLPIWSFVFFIITIFLLLQEIESHLNAVLRIGHGAGLLKQRHFSISFLIHWILLVLGPVFLCGSVFLSAYITHIALWQHWVMPVDMNIGLNISYSYLESYILPGFVTVLGFLILYLLIPAGRINFWHALIGALFSGVLFELSKILFGLYLKYFPTYELLYGALAVIPIFLIWVFLAWSIFLLGAEVIKAIRNKNI